MQVSLPSMFPTPKMVGSVGMRPITLICGRFVNHLACLPLMIPTLLNHA
jgi:hypothetical protein